MFWNDYLLSSVHDILQNPLVRNQSKEKVSSNNIITQSCKSLKSL